MKSLKKRIVMGVVILLFFLMQIEAFADQDWEVITQLPTKRWEFSTAVVADKIYLIGGSLFENRAGPFGLSTVEVYDPQTNTWQRGADMPTPRTNAKAAVVNGTIYVFGGYNSKDKFLQNWKMADHVEAYDPRTDTWTQKTDMPTPRKTKTCVVDGKIYAVGGWSTANEQSKLETVEVYDPATDTWAKAQSMNHARCSAAMSVVNGEIYAVGGIGAPNRDPSGQYLSSRYLSNVEVFNPKTNQWQERTEMSVPKAAHSTSVIDGKIYVMGGYLQEGKEYKTFSTIEIYDPATDRWTQASDMLIGKSGHATEVVDGQIYIFGGGPPTSVQVYDPRIVSRRVNSIGKL